MTRYIKYLIKRAHVALVREMMYRLHFTLSVIGGLIVTAMMFVFNVVFAEKTGNRFWTRDEALLITASFMIVDGFVRTVFHGLSNLPSAIRFGEIDFEIIKPLNVQLIFSTQFFNWDHTFTFALGIAGVLYVSLLSNIYFSPLSVVLFIISIISGIIIYYSIKLMIMSLSFWIIHGEGLDSLANRLFHLGMYPPDVFGKAISFTLRFMIPIVFLAVIPTKVVINNSYVYVLSSIIVAMLLLIISKKFFYFGLRNYQSVSS